MTLPLLRDGEVLAVETTGIYCRGGCSGRPHAWNVERLRSPAAAEAAGYRPCLKCRPDEAPLVTVKDSTIKLIRDALTLIGSGYLDTCGESQLGFELGVSTRHLRRLFVDEVGATPSQIAKSRRAHFARRLLDDTDLSMTEVAFASGFGSLRRFNAVMTEVFRFAPSSLRAKRRTPQFTAIDGGLTLQLRSEASIDFAEVLERLAAQAAPGVESTVDGVFRRTVSLHGHPGVVELSALDANRLRVIVHLPEIHGLINVVSACRRIAAIDDFGDGHQAWDPFEARLKSLIASCHGSAESATILGSVVTACGPPVGALGDSGLSHVFPTAGQVLELKACRFSGNADCLQQIRELARSHCQPSRCN